MLTSIYLVIMNDMESIVGYIFPFLLMIPLLHYPSPLFEDSGEATDTRK